MEALEWASGRTWALSEAEPVGGTVDGGSPLKRKGISGSCFQFVLDAVPADLVKLPVQHRDSLRPRVVFPKLGRCQGRFET